MFFDLLVQLFIILEYKVVHFAFSAQSYLLEENNPQIVSSRVSFWIVPEFYFFGAIIAVRESMLMLCKP